MPSLPEQFSTSLPVPQSHRESEWLPFALCMHYSDEVYAVRHQIAASLWCAQSLCFLVSPNENVAARLCIGFPAYNHKQLVGIHHL